MMNPIKEPMSEEELVELEDISRRSALPDAGHQHWFPNVYADQLLKEVRRLRKECTKWKADNQNLYDRYEKLEIKFLGTLL